MQSGHATASRPRSDQRRVAPPRLWHVRATDVFAAVGFNAVLIVGMWVRHGGLDSLGTATANLTAIGQLTALLGTYLALIQLVLMSRSPWLEQLFGMDRIAHWHRWLGFGTAALIGGHVVATTAGYALGDGRAFFTEFWTMVSQYPFVLQATVATGLMVMIVFTSIRAARMRLEYETWHFIHLYAYLFVALGFGHVLVVGTDFINDPLARFYWVALYAVAFGLVLAFRVGHPLQLARRHQLRVSSVVNEAPGVVSIYVTGRDLRSLRARAGQYFTWRFLARDGWWKAHPFSLSAAPNGEFLRLTVKDVGAGTADVHRIQPGTRVLAEGPYGVFTTRRRTKTRYLLVAAGIGITPIRALLEELPGGKGNAVLLYRVRNLEQAVFKGELDELARTRQATVHYLVGERGRGGMTSEPITTATVRRLVPDVQQRDVYVCGPAGFMTHVREVLEELGLPQSQLHYERFALL